MTQHAVSSLPTPAPTPAPTSTPTPAPAPAGRPSPDTPSLGWWRDAVIYQVYVRSFADSDGDGVGDLPGARQRLPYLAGLGVDAVWLTPFYASPQADGGYDVSDYRAVDPRFGDLSDAEGFITEAHDLGLRVIVDIVPNHTSDQHAWFRAALAGDEEARARYHVRPGRGEGHQLPPNDWESVFGGPAWSRLPGDEGLWYLHLFAPEQPDLDWENPQVHAEFDAVIRFWLDLGVDGFRIDVAHGMVKAPGLPDIGRKEQARMIGAQQLPFFDQDGVHEIHRSWRRLLESYGPDRIGVAEAWAPTSERLALYVRPDELHQAFNFQFLRAGWDARELREVIEESMAATTRVGAPTTWVLSNHDVVRHRTRLGSLARARAAALLMLALPGSVYLYQGEELGLPEVTALPDEVRQDPAFFRATGDQAGQDGLRDGCRVPLPWSTEGPSWGFGPGDSWLPQPAEWRGLSVRAQTGDPDSTLELYRTALRLRRRLPGLGDSAMEWLAAPEGVLALSRPGLMCVVNTRDSAVEMTVPGRLLLSSTPGATDEAAAPDAPGSPDEAPNTAPAPDAAEAPGGRLIPANSCTWWAA
ncbi:MULTISPECIES: glycoside hydrolase family 13 protein [unclassified Streptomyces]|uniref:glycoside hydrolase family 13 protein n=1 Tax=unclassified Streptomyces TaxID=2593676 RepID=UPI002DD8E206|nr:glycoside hydrolase family 13 protein [Streptomyces sp. NBC_01795]WSA95160.1 glycoside hydrolase family 13 protein [Streptomyces sp. NBC_01795]WSS40929.1 glycoside hydrolase family 13 protein [Streptomyces sp. NBC_01187]